MIRQWVVKGIVNDHAFECEVLAQDESQARDFAVEQLADYAWKTPRITSVTATGHVLVHESELRGRDGRK